MTRIAIPEPLSLVQLRTLLSEAHTVLDMLGVPDIGTPAKRISAFARATFRKCVVLEKERDLLNDQLCDLTHDFALLKQRYDVLAVAAGKLPWDALGVMDCRPEEGVS